MEIDSRLVYCAKSIVRPVVQIIAFLTTFMLSIVIGYSAFTTFHSFDQPVSLHPVTPDQILQWGGDPPIPVSVGLHLDKFAEFDVPKNKFVFDAIIWFEFNPTHISLDTVSQFSFYNGKILKKSEPDIQLLSEQDKLFVRYNVTVEFRSNLYYKYFPMDDHRLYIILTNKYVSPRELVFKGSLSSFTVSNDMFVRGWENVGRDVWSGYTDSLLDMLNEERVVENPSVSFTVDFQRSGILIFLLIFLPMFVVCFIGLFAFAFDPQEYAHRIMALSSGSITGLLGYRFVIQQLSPPAGGFTLSDHMFILFLSFSFVVFILSMVFIHAKEMTPALYVVRGFVFIAFHVLLLAWWYYLLYLWV